MIAAFLLALLPQAQPNVLVIVLDDVGTDMIGAYSSTAPCTPYIDGLAASGARFERAYANPVCSPTRALLLTGRYAYRTGVGNALIGNRRGLDSSETTLAEHMQANGYATWGSGKWHLTGPPTPPKPPESQGFDHWRGTAVGGAIQDYFAWPRYVDGVVETSTTYATTRQVVDALELAVTAEEPWFGLVSFNSAHSPFHEPPYSRGCSTDQDYREMVESLDLAVQALVEGLLPLVGPTWLFVLGDNGTPNGVDSACPAGFKGTTYEGGVLVPWIVVGPDLAPASVGGLISAVDLPATVCDLVGIPQMATAIDGLSFAPVLVSGCDSARDFAFVEWFTNNGLPVDLSGRRLAVIEERFKLTLNATGASNPEELFDLASDPCEAQDLLLAPLSTEAQAAYDRLQDRLEGLN